MADSILKTFDPYAMGSVRKMTCEWKSHSIEMEKQRDYWIRRVEELNSYQTGDVWFWQDDGEDHLESMSNSMLVVIRADKLRELVSPIEKAPMKWDGIVRPEDFRVDTYASTAGWFITQSKNARITHIPTGIVVSCESERSAHGNVAIAWKEILKQLEHNIPK